MSKFKPLIDAINHAESIAILPHLFPDGDALGTAIALQHGLKKIGKNPVIFSNDPLPSNLSVITETAEIIAYESLSQAAFDLAISVDSGSVDLLKDRAPIFDQARCTALIDHHKTNTQFAMINIVDDTAAAAAEIVYELFQEMNIVVDPPIARAIFTALLTDTGCFRYESTTARTFKTAAALREIPFDYSALIISIFQTVKRSKIDALSKALSHMQMNAGGNIAWTILNQSEMESNGFSGEDTDGIVESLRDIDGIEVAIFARYIGHQRYKFSMRSKQTVDVSAIASSFSGGGHLRAAGFSTDRAVDDVIEQVLLAVEEQCQ